MILAAGRGERLRPLTDSQPKPLLPIAGAPLIVHQLRWLRRAGVAEVVVNTHHLAAQVERCLGTGEAFGLHIRISREAELLDTGGGIRQALPWLGPGPFLVLNGDIWTDYDFAALVHPTVPAEAEVLGHLVLTPTPAHLAHGDFHLDARGLARREPAANKDLTYCGIARLTTALFDAAPDGPFSLREPYFGAAAAGRLTGERFAGTWIDIGTPGQLARARRVGKPTRAAGGAGDAQL